VGVLEMILKGHENGLAVGSALAEMMKGGTEEEEERGGHIFACI